MQTKKVEDQLPKKASDIRKPLGFGNTSRRFSQSERRSKGAIAKDRFAFDQALQGHDCSKICESGDFVVQKRDFFGEKVGEPIVFEVKTGNSKLTEAQEQRQRRLGRNRYKIARY
jgi:hypothetical protein